MLFRFIQYCGLSVIVMFCAWSIFISTSAREFNTYGPVPLIYSYASYFEDRFYDIRMKFTIDKTKKDNRLVLAAIDDESLKKIGRWPWSRSTIAKLVDKLNLYGAKVIAFDVFFSEPELACNAESPDILLANSLTNFNNQPNRKAILPYSLTKKIDVDLKSDRFITEIPDELLFESTQTRLAEGVTHQEYIIEKNVYPLPNLAATNSLISHIEAEADTDGVFRHYPLLANVENVYLPSFALHAYKAFTSEPYELLGDSSEESYLQTKNGKIYINYNGEAKVRWAGGLDHFPTVSIQAILSAKENDPEMHAVFKDNLVFIGSIAFGANDIRNTPVDPILPGVVFHMNMVNMLLDGNNFVAGAHSTRASWIMLIGGSLLIILIMLMGNAVLDFFAVILISGALFYIDTYILIPKGYNNRLFFCLFSVVNCYSWSTFLNFYQSNKEKKKIKGTFSRYLAPSIVNDLLKNPDKVRLGGEKKNITVFFSDVRDFTSISEQLTPEELTHCINKYMTMMTDTLFEHNGTLDKYIGDAMVAYWGAPVELENHPYWAVKGAIQMIERLPAINEEFVKEGFPEFKHGIGLNTGDCSVGNMGSNQIFSYTALGDNMNLGARLESLCKFYGVQLNVSEYTINAIPPEMRKEFVIRTLDKVKVKGKEKPVTIYEIMHPTHPLYNETLELKSYEEAFSMYLKQDFLGAEIIFQSLQIKYPEDPTFKRMLSATKDYLKLPPPPDWDGTYTHQSK